MSPVSGTPESRVEIRTGNGDTVLAVLQDSRRQEPSSLDDRGQEKRGGEDDVLFILSVRGRPEIPNWRPETVDKWLNWRQNARYWISQCYGLEPADFVTATYYTSTRNRYPSYGYVPVKWNSFLISSENISLFWLKITIFSRNNFSEN